MGFKLTGGGAAAANIGVGAEAASAGHVTVKPIPHGALGHYRVAGRFAIVNTQAAASRLVSLRNTGSNLIIPTRLNLRWLQIGTHTAAIEDSLDVFRVTSFTVQDTTNTVTPVPSIQRTGMGASPGNVQVRHVTAAGAAAGMTGGTLTKDSAALAQLPKWLLAAMPTAGSVEPSFLDAFDDVNGTHPFVLAQNEGLIVENRVLLGAAASSAVYFDMCYVETTAF
jgi:hypothetical protein